MSSQLPSHFEYDLLRSVQLVADHALPDADVDKLNSLAEGLLSVFDNALASVYRTYNLKHSSQQRLPNEIWCIVWDFLPLDSVLSVSRVCHSWRSLALSCPGLWNKLAFWSSRHADSCHCHDCRFPDGSESDASSLVMHNFGTSNIEQIIALLPRSQSLPLTLHITIFARRPDLDIVGQLAQTVRQHAHRIAVLHFFAEGSTVPLAFFPIFQELPALKSLHVESPKDEETGGFGFASSGTAIRLRLPALQKLSLTAGIGILPQFHKTLTSLQLPYVSAADALDYIQQAPNLEHLQLRFPIRVQGRFMPHDSLELKAACIRVPRVEVSNIRPSSAPRAMQLLDAQYASLTFGYADACQYSGLGVLATVPDAAWFSLLQRLEDMSQSDRLIFSLGNGTRTRTLSLPMPTGIDLALKAAWDAHPAPLHAPTATVSLAALPCIPQRVADMVTSLVVEMPTVAAQLATTSVPSFPALETLEFRYDPLRHALAHYSEISISTIAQVLRRGADRKLRSLVADGAMLDEDNSLLAEIANNIVLLPPAISRETR